jgi:hypothetical protein
MADIADFEERIELAVDRYDDKIPLEAMELSLQQASHRLRQRRDVEGGETRA